MLRGFWAARKAKSLKNLGSDEFGTLSFEYVIVAACIVGAVGAVFGGAGPGTVVGGLTSGLTAITNAIVGAV